MDHCLLGLKPVRHYRGMSLSEAAELVGVNPSSYARFEGGTRRLYFDKACILADALRCRLDDLREYRDPDQLRDLLGPNLPKAPPAPPPPPPVDTDIVVAAEQLRDWGEASE